MALSAEYWERRVDQVTLYLERVRASGSPYTTESVQALKAYLRWLHKMGRQAGAFVGDAQGAGLVGE